MVLVTRLKILLAPVSPGSVSPRLVRGWGWSPHSVRCNSTVSYLYLLLSSVQQDYYEFSFLIGSVCSMLIIYCANLLIITVYRILISLLHIACLSQYRVSDQL